MPTIAVDFKAFVDGYVTCMLWSSNDNSTDAGGEPLDSNYSAEDIPEDDKKAIEADCRRFSRAHAALLLQAVNRPGYTSERAGHDFWLTREGHGAGFWDRAELEAGKLGANLTTASQAFGAHREGGPWIEKGQVRYGRSKDEQERLEAEADPRRRPAIEAVKAALPTALGEALDCLRVWGAWSVGTMSEADFVQVADQDDRVQEIAEAVVDARRSLKDPLTAETLHTALSEALALSLGDAYDCAASWDAWREGTMCADNFRQVGGNDRRLSEMTVAVAAALTPQFGPAPKDPVADASPARRLRRR
jgi:hypothetical protein